MRDFRRDRSRSYGDAASANAVIHGDNLDAMRRLASSPGVGPFRCIYFDPPFNSRRHFDEYHDALRPEAWAQMIAQRLEAAHALLADDGAMVAEIDDNELGSLSRCMDEVFGRNQRISIVTVVRSAPTGHKAKNLGPVNVADYLLIYAKSRARFRPNPVFCERKSYDRAYGTWLENPDSPLDQWRFVALATHVREHLGQQATRADIEAYAILHAGQVVRFAQPRYEAVSYEARAQIDRSKTQPDRVVRLERDGAPDLLLFRGNRILFLENKVQKRGDRAVLVEPLTNVWSDIGFQGIANEGGARFPRNKKPERLLARILAVTTEPGDWVLDAFLGSGTTAAVAHKMGRRWIGVECGSHVDTLCLPRLRRVVDGTDKAGVTREFNWKGGGGFHVWT